MKAKFFFLGLCALGLMACSIDEVSRVNDSNAIQFKATTATRAAATTTNNISAFSVWAWNTVEGVTQTTPFMDGVTASKSGSVFTTSPLYFWPTGTVDFYAISPVAETFGIEDDSVERAYFGGELNAEGDDEGNSWTYTGNVAKATVANDEIVFDVVIPSKASDQIDLCYAITKGQSSGSVAMNFRHALSQVVFKARNTNSALDIDIQGVSVCSVFKEGTFTLKDVASTTADITAASEDSMGSWDYDTESHKARFEAGITPQTLSGVSEEAVTLTTTADGSATGSLMLLPQSVAKWDPDTDKKDENLGSYIAVLCRVTENGSLLWPNANETGNTETVGGVECAYIAVPVDIDWEAGYCYTYTIIFGDGLGYYPPDDTNFDLEGTEVLVPITFTVTVDEFQSADEVDVPTTTIDLTTITVSTAEELADAVSKGYKEINVVLPDGETNSTLTLDSCLEFTYDCVLNIAEGVTITGPDAVDGTGSIIYVNGCNLTINSEGTIATDGTDSSYNTSAILVVDGSVIINGGTYKGGSWNDAEQAGNIPTIYVDNGSATIHDGKFYGGIEEDETKSIFGTDNSGTIIIDGGTFYGSSPKAYLADGYCSFTFSDSTYGMGDKWDGKKYTVEETLLINGHQYVDLGNSVNNCNIVWATCNLGADSPVESGNYYAWGETSTKETYTSDNSLYYKNNDAYTYGTDAFSGDTDYDPVTLLWGSPWRTPTADELDKLATYTKQSWTEEEGVYGFEVISSYDAYRNVTLFFPACGYYSGTTLNNAAEDPGKGYGAVGQGYIWGSEPYKASSDSNGQYAYCISYKRSKSGTDSNPTITLSFSQTNQTRYYGIPIRPVADMP